MRALPVEVVCHHFHLTLDFKTKAINSLYQVNTLRHYSNHELNQTQLVRDLRVVSASGNDTYAHLEYADPYRDGGGS